MSPFLLTRIVAGHLRAWQRVKGYTDKDMGDILYIPALSYLRVIEGNRIASTELICTVVEKTGIPLERLVVPLGSYRQDGGDRDIPEDKTLLQRELVTKWNECSALLMKVVQG